MDRRTFLSLVPVTIAGGLLAPREAAAEVELNQRFVGLITSLRPREGEIRFVGQGRTVGGHELVAMAKTVQVFSEKADATYRIVPGLSDSRFVSFELIRRPGCFLSLVKPPPPGGSWYLAFRRATNDEAFRLMATFDVRPGGAAQTFRFESVAERGRYFRADTGEGSPAYTRVYVLAPNIHADFHITNPQMDRFSFRSMNFLDRFIRHRNFLGELTTIAPIDELDATFVIRGGLADKRMISLEAKNFPGLFLRHQNFRLRLTSHSELGDGNDATFRLVPALGSGADGAVSLESRNFPGRFIRHRNFQLWLDPNDASDLFKGDASFVMDEPRAR